MNIIQMAFVLVMALAVVGQTDEHGSRPASVNTNSQLTSREMPSRLETINYDWDKYRVRVAFHRQTRDAAWHMTVEDSWSVYDQFKKAERTWGLSECRCSLEEYLEIVGRSLTLFRAEKPDAKLETIHLEMQVAKELWTEVLAGLQRRLSLLDDKKTTSRADIPDEVEDELLRVWNKSPMNGKTIALLERHGIHIKSGRPSTLVFKDSLNGRKWSEIAKLADAGILVPGRIELELIRN